MLLGPWERVWYPEGKTGLEGPVCCWKESCVRKGWLVRGLRPQACWMASLRPLHSRLSEKCGSVQIAHLRWVQTQSFDLIFSMDSPV